MLFAASGLLAIFWEKGAGKENLLRPTQLVGAGLCFSIGLLWFYAAWKSLGDPLIDKMLEKELIGHVVGDAGKPIPGSRLPVPFLYLLSTFMPWGLVAVAGAVRLIRRPPDNEGARRFARYCLVVVGTGLLVLGLASHQRHLHLWPLVPCVALLAGWEMSQWQRLRQMAPQRLMLGLAGAAAVFFVVAGYYRSVALQDDPRVIDTMMAEQIAADIRGEVGSAFPLIHVRTPYAVQFYLGTMSQRVSTMQAAEALAGEASAFALVQGTDKIQDLAERPLFELRRWPMADRKDLVLISNHPRLEYTERMATYEEDLLVEMRNLHYYDRDGNRMAFWSKAPSGSLRIINKGPDTETREILIENVQKEEEIVLLTLEPGQEWSREINLQRQEGSPIRVALFSDCRGATRQLLDIGAQGIFTPADYVLVNGDFTFERRWHYDSYSQDSYVGRPGLSNRRQP
ncbi:MAG: hypothetical protein HC888_13680 [Candidatus Competibacteraceae bacterium]|nr:hypothetical protein [Candidatus Competibacteraceae bacterium]